MASFLPWAFLPTGSTWGGGSSSAGHHMAKQPGERTQGELALSRNSFSLTLASQLGCFQRGLTNYLTQGSQKHPPIHLLGCSHLRQEGLADCLPISIVAVLFQRNPEPSCSTTHPSGPWAELVNPIFSSGTLKGRGLCALGLVDHGDSQWVGPGFLCSFLYFKRFLILF